MADPIRLCYNENILGASPKAMAALQAALGEAALYPDGLIALLQERVAAHLGHGLTAEQVVMGNGCSDILQMALEAMVQPGQKVVIAENTFGLYEWFTRRSGGVPVLVPLRDHVHDLDAMLAAIDADTALVIICNPNNPTGTMVSHEALGRFLAALPPHVTAVIDEAYFEFVAAVDFPDVHHFLAAGYPILVTRTFSKIYGLAGLRVGYGFGAARLVNAVRRRRTTFNMARPSAKAALAALDDAEHVQRSVALVGNGRQTFYDAFDELGLAYPRSQANFVYVTDLPLTAAEICALTLAYGVQLRPTNDNVAPHNLRITIGLPAHNEAVIAVLAAHCGASMRR